MEETDWDSYGTGNYEKCAQCMVHSGYEATAVVDSVHHPMKAAVVALRGVRTEGEMAPEIPLDRPAPGRIRVLAPCRGRHGPARAVPPPAAQAGRGVGNRRLRPAGV